jgi:hypothetical protein
MIARNKNIVSHLVTFALGLSLAFVMMQVLNFVNEIVFGFEIRSRTSFPMTHMAKLRTRPGGGDQTLFLEVDGKDVWRSGDMPPGDLGEELSWDAAGKIVTLELQEQPFIRYDAESKKIIETGNKEPIKLR